MKSSNARSWQTATLIIVAIGLIVFALSGYLRPALRAATTPLLSAQEWISSRFIAMYEFVTVPRDVASLRASNDELEKEVAQLQAQIIELNQQLREQNVLYALLNFERANPTGSQYRSVRHGSRHWARPQSLYALYFHQSRFR